MLPFERQLEDVVDSLQNAKKENIKVNLLIGAGCSVTANIPAADGLIDKIKNYYPRDYNRANYKDYATCMSKLTPFERRNLIKNIVNESKVNWAHIAIAQLLKNNFVHRIITTNFDNLVQRACSLVGEFPAIYDLTTSENFRTDLLFEKSVLHLHGQHTGFILCNTGDEVERQAKIIKPIFEQLNQNSLWIIVGYSGNNDPIFQLLTERELFEYRLFWVGYKDGDPNQNLRSNLLSEEKYAFFVRGYDADSFFVLLSQKLGCFPPNFIRAPFTYLADTLETISNYNTPKLTLPSDLQNKVHLSSDIQLTTKRVVQKAIDSIENDKALMAEHFLLAGLLEEVINLDDPEENNEELNDHIISALLTKGEPKSLEIAQTKLEELIQETNKAKHHSQLGTAFLTRAFVDDVDIDFSYLIKAYEQFKISIELENNWLDVILLNSVLNKLFATFKLEAVKYKVGVNELEEYALDFIDIFSTQASMKGENFTSRDIALSSGILNPQYIYDLIEYSKFDTAEKALVITENYKKLYGGHTAYIEANRGLWYFRNQNIEPHFAEENGKSCYESAISIIFKQEANKNPNNALLKAFKQKYFYEYACFLFRMNKEKEATEALLEAISLGENSVDKNIYRNCIALANEKEHIHFIKNTLKQVASTKEYD